MGIHPLMHGHSAPHGYSREEGNLALGDPLLPNREVDVEDVVVVPDAQSASNEVGSSHPIRVECQTKNVVVPR